MRRVALHLLTLRSAPSLLLCLCVAASCSHDRRSGRSHPAPRRPDVDVERVFRQRAGDGVEAIRLAALDVAMEPDARRQLIAAMDDHRAAVDAEVAAWGGATPLADHALQRAEELSAEFEATTLQPWSEAHPAAFEQLQTRFTAWEAIGRCLAEDPEPLGAALSAAGLPPERLAQASDFVGGARQRLLDADELNAGREREITAMPRGPERDLAEAAFEREFQRALFNASRSTYDALRRMIPEERRDGLDERLMEIEFGGDPR